MVQSVRRQAVVLGGGIAGLLAARVLSETYQEVLVVERDELTGVTGPRRGVPQGRHAHALLARGQQILEELLPGLHDDMHRDGVPSGDLAGDLRWYFQGRRLAPGRTGLVSLSATRPVLEAYIRDRVVALPNVSLLESCVVRGLVTGDGHRKITGVRVVEGDREEEVETDLVVDATGRGSRTPVWLRELGYESPIEERVKVDLAYTTRHYRLSRDPYGNALSINPVAFPEGPRGAFFPRLADGSSMLSLTGLLGDHPPTDDRGFLDFTSSLAAPEIADALRDAEPLDDPVTFRYPDSVWRRYDRLRDFPSGLLVIGDGVCSFNPVYGQGMTVAAMQALVLAKHVRRQESAQRYFAEVASVISVPWMVSAGGDLGFPQVAGRRSLLIRMMNAYVARLHVAAAKDPVLTSAFFRVAGLVDPPYALFRPRVVLRVLAGLGRRPRPVLVPSRSDADLPVPLSPWPSERERNRGTVPFEHSPGRPR